MIARVIFEICIDACGFDGGRLFDGVTGFGRMRGFIIVGVIGGVLGVNFVGGHDGSFFVSVVSFFFGSL